MAMDQSVGCLITSVVCFGILLLCIFLPLSLKRVDENEVAIVYCKIARKLGDTLEDGLHSVCVDSQLFRFPRTIVDIELSDMQCLSSDGLELDLTLTTQYRYDIDNIKNILFEYDNEEFLAEYISAVVQGSVRNICSNYTSEEYYLNRGVIETAMGEYVIQQVNAADAYVLCEFFQLQNIALPEALTVSIINKQAALERVDVLRNERDQILIEAETQVIEAAQVALANIISSQADASARIVSAEASADALVAVNVAETESILKAAEFEVEGVFAAWNFTRDAILANIEILDISPDDYVERYLLPQLTTEVLNTEVSACLQTADPETAWWCWSDSYAYVPS